MNYLDESSSFVTDGVLRNIKCKNMRGSDFTPTFQVVSGCTGYTSNYAAWTRNQDKVRVSGAGTVTLYGTPASNVVFNFTNNPTSSTGATGPNNAAGWLNARENDTATNFGGAIVVATGPSGVRFNVGLESAYANTGSNLNVAFDYVYDVINEA